MRYAPCFWLLSWTCTGDNGLPALQRPTSSAGIVHPQYTNGVSSPSQTTAPSVTQSRDGTPRSRTLVDSLKTNTSHYFWTETSSPMSLSNTTGTTNTTGTLTSVVSGARTGRGPPLTLGATHPYGVTEAHSLDQKSMSTGAMVTTPVTHAPLGSQKSRTVESLDRSRELRCCGGCAPPPRVSSAHPLPFLCPDEDQVFPPAGAAIPRQEVCHLPAAVEQWMHLSQAFQLLFMDCVSKPPPVPSMALAGNKASEARSGGWDAFATPGWVWLRQWM